jgi:hypothetical protein
MTTDQAPRFGEGEDGMKKHFFLSGLAAALLGLGVAQGQGPTNPQSLGNPYSGGGNPSGVPSAGQGGATPAPAGIGAPPNPYDGYTGGPPAYGVDRGNPDSVPGPGTSPSNTGGGMSSWLEYARSPLTCGPVGRNGPIGEELYFRAGPSLPFGGGPLGAGLGVGFTVEGGARTLFFDKDDWAAWVLDIGVTNTHYNANAASHPVTLNNYNSGGGTTPIPSIEVNVSGLNQTFVNLALGREYWIWAPAYAGQPTWRVGFDFGGGISDSRVNFHEVRHNTGTTGEGLFDIHSDWEYPCKRAVLYGGVRLEYRYSYSSEILQRDNNGSLMSIDILGELGVRF